MTHILIALVLQALVAWPLGWWAGAAAASLYFLGREYAQAEHRVIRAHYRGRRVEMPWWGGLQPRAWTRKGLWDFLAPTAAVCAVAALAGFAASSFKITDAPTGASINHSTPA